MISEGVDIPRAACLAWMTSYRTPLFFAQAVGRVVRARGSHETATVFLPAVRPLLALAAELEVDRNHVLAPPADPGETDDTDALDLLPVERDAAGGELERLESQAEFAHVLHSGRAVTAGPGALPPELLTDDDEDFLGLPGLLTPEQTAALLARRDSALRRRADEAARGGDRLLATGTDDVLGSAGSSGWRAAADLRREVNQLVGRLAARTGAPHATVHAEIRRAVPGPPSAAASAELLERRRDHLLGRL